MTQTKPFCPSALTALALCLLAVGACDDDAPPPGNPLAEIASSKALLAPPPAATSAAPSEPEAPVARRPNNTVELLLNPERRAAIEAKFPEARGFLDVKQLEAQLHKRDLARNKLKAAIAPFDKLAKGKWVLFTGHLQDLTPEGFAMPVHYTPRAPRDLVGLSASYFPVTIRSVKGYDPSEYEHGELAAVLAKYEGKQSASPAYDLIMLRNWFLKPAGE